MVRHDCIPNELYVQCGNLRARTFYETFRPAEARRILDKIEFHYTPKHGSWLNMVETEINIMGRQCLNRRPDNRSLMAEEVAAWQNARNARKARIHWTFTLAVARQKLRKLYPSIEDRRITRSDVERPESLTQRHSSELDLVSPESLRSRR